MRKKNVLTLLGFAVIAMFLIPGCQQAQTEILLEAEANSGSSGEFETLTLESGQEAMVVQPGGWLSFDLPVKVAGAVHRVWMKV